MIDAALRRWIDPPLNKAGARLANLGVTANQVTWTGFAIGMLAIPLLAIDAYHSAILVIGINRLCDGLDGAVARVTDMTDLGGYLDIVLDFIFYSAVVFGLVLAQSDQAVFGAYLIFSFIGTGASFLAYSTFALKRGLTTQARGKKSLYYLGGLTEGFETILCLLLLCLLPNWLWLIASLFGTLCWITTASRVMTAMHTLRQ